MRDEEARKQLKHALDEQQSIRTNKLGGILQVMNVSLKKNNHDKEIEYLRNEVKKLHKALRKKGG